MEREINGTKLNKGKRKKTDTNTDGDLMYDSICILNQWGKVDYSMSGFGTPAKFSKYEIKANNYMPTNMRIKSLNHLFHQKLFQMGQ